MYTPKTSKHFVAYVDPESGIKSYILSSRVAPIQQGFYFVNSSFSADGRYLWFYCAFPPTTGHTIGLLDFLTDEMYYFPATGGSGYMVEQETGNLIYGTVSGFYMQVPNPACKPIRIAKIPDMFRDMQVFGSASHLTFTPDHKEIAMDFQTSKGSYIGSIRLSDEKFTLWYHTPKGIPFNHAQLCPTNPDLIMCAHEFSRDPETGKMVAPPLTKDGLYPRIQIITRDGKCEMRPLLGNHATHEWWAPDGKSIYYVNNMINDDPITTNGLVVHDRLGNNKPELIGSFPIPGGVGAWHGYCSQNEKYFVIDGAYPSMGLTWWRGCESTVRFFNKDTQKIVSVITKNPILETWTAKEPCTYHIDPHPRFVLNDTMITFTTTVLGHVDVGVAETDQLMKATE